MTNAELDAVALQNDARQGEIMLRRVTDFLSRFVSYPCEHSLTAHALWIVHTHLMDTWDSTPRIAFLSAEPSSGKTRALEVTELLVPRPVTAVNVSPAYLFRKVADEKGAPTILYDEIDTVFGPKAKENEEIRGLLNAGHRKGAVAGRCVVRGATVLTEEIPAYSAVALAGLGWLPDTILSRSIIIRMRRRKTGERVEPYRRRLHAAGGEVVRQMIHVWAAGMSGSITWPELPPQIEDRDADVWEPLIAVADAVGGEWPARARKAAVALVSASKEVEPSLGIRLLADLKMVFGNDDQLSTDILLHRLHGLNEAPWNDLKGKPLNDRGLAHRLRQYGVKPQTIRLGDATPRGYKREDLFDAWARYLPPPPVTSKTSKTSATAQDFQEVIVADDVSDVADIGPAKGQKNTSKISIVADVADVLDWPANGSGRRPCVQCNLDDGQQELQQHNREPIWLHRQCVRFWKRSHS
jgi:Protein of unknown function (DUF3631)